jgi:hypothetical protein
MITINRAFEVIELNRRKSIFRFGIQTKLWRPDIEVSEMSDFKSLASAIDFLKVNCPDMTKVGGSVIYIGGNKLDSTPVNINGFKTTSDYLITIKNCVSRSSIPSFDIGTYEYTKGLNHDRR